MLNRRRLTSLLPVSKHWPVVLGAPRRNCSHAPVWTARYGTLLIRDGRATPEAKESDLKPRRHISDGNPSIYRLHAPPLGVRLHWDLGRRTVVLDPKSASWKATAAYLYALRLDGTALAWEYLRRNHEYRALWRQVGHDDLNQSALHWGLRFRRGPRSRCPPRLPRVVARAGGRYSPGSQPRCLVGVVAAFDLEAARSEGRHSRRHPLADRLLRNSAADGSDSGQQSSGRRCIRIPVARRG